ncbi:unnamed protein product [Trichogramma brassicae]|uniref:SOCS box domain-containing protein n=1 Tax=Trichogramma brassicae TaxID=86971 RepID=A0A6H5J1K7_9HYME|nr:unnamed protein product [Trichogramma brassicae]
MESLGIILGSSSHNWADIENSHRINRADHKSREESKEDRILRLLTYELTSLLSDEQSIDERCSLFDSYLTMCIQTNYGFMTVEDYQSVLRNESLFPSITDVFKVAVERSHVAIVTFLQMFMEPNFHKLTLKDGKSALHFLVKNFPCKYHGYHNELTTTLVQTLLTIAKENLCDAYGFTYFHGACLFGAVEIVRKFISAGVDVNLDSYACSPLHVAVKYRRVEVVRILLKHGADPNKLDTEGKSTPLHVLAKRRVCDCFEYCTDDTDCETIVDLLVANGANIEARVSEQDHTPLECAVSHLDLDLAKSLLKRRASLNGDYTPRANEIWHNIHFHLLAHEKFGFFTKQEALKYLLEARERMGPMVPESHKGSEFFDMISNNLEAELTKMKRTMLTEDTSLYQLCRMSYTEGSSILTKMRNWPSTKLSYMKLLRPIVKKHLANTFMRVDWSNEDERVIFQQRLGDLFDEWKYPLPNLRDVFPDEEIDWLIWRSAELKRTRQARRREARLIEFVARTGYKDEPEKDEAAGEASSLPRRTTALHRAARRGFYDEDTAMFGELFKIYHRLEVNYVDEFGLTHFHVACRYGLKDVVEEFLRLGQVDPNQAWPDTGDTPLHLALRHNTRRRLDDGVLEDVVRGQRPSRSVGADRRPGQDGLVGAALRSALQQQEVGRAAAETRRRSELGHHLWIEWTPLHLIGGYTDDDDLAKIFFEVCDERELTIRVDARSKLSARIFMFHSVEKMPKTNAERVKYTDYFQRNMLFLILFQKIEMCALWLKKTLNWIYMTQLKTLMNLSLMIWEQKLKVTKAIKLKQLGCTLIYA